MLHVEKAVILPGYRIRVTFSTGETRVFNMEKMLDYPVYTKLKDEAVFSNFTIRRGVVTWDDGNIDIAPEYMYYHHQDDDISCEEHSARPGAGLDIIDKKLLVQYRQVLRVIKNKQDWSRAPGWKHPVRFGYRKRIRAGKASEYDYILEGMDSAVGCMKAETIRRYI